MDTLVDTCILLRAFEKNTEHYKPIREALRKAIKEKTTLVVTVQNLAEFWNAGTRPLDKNGQGLSAEKVKRRIEIIELFCKVVAEDTKSFGIWKGICEKYSVLGVKVHDARLVSVMLRQGTKRIITLNKGDFLRYAGEGITVETPEDFLK